MSYCLVYTLDVHVRGISKCLSAILSNKDSRYHTMAIAGASVSPSLQRIGIDLINSWLEHRKHLVLSALGLSLPGSTYGIQNHQRFK